VRRAAAACVRRAAAAACRAVRGRPSFMLMSWALPRPSEAAAAAAAAGG
jgi:hypothetical protein